MIQVRSVFKIAPVRELIQNANIAESGLIKVILRLEFYIGP